MKNNLSSTGITVGILGLAFVGISHITEAPSEVVDSQVSHLETPAQAMAKVQGKGRERVQFHDIDVDIEIEQAEEIGNGVQVFARAWNRQGKQIAFGDGTVEIERFRIFNPPLLVDDPTGDIVREYHYTRPNGEVVHEIRRLKRDPERALKEILAHNIKIAGKNSDKIVAGKRGNTTDTYYPDAGTGATTVDGIVRTDEQPGTFAQAHDALTTANEGGLGGAFPSQATTDYPGIGTYGYLTNARQVISRGIFNFDTSGIDDTDTIDSATFSIYITGKENSDNDGDDWLNVVQNTIATDNTIVAGDFDQVGAVSNPTEGATRIDLGSITTGAYNDWTLNATGLTWIVKTGVTKLGMREGHDAINVALNGNNIGNQIESRMADFAGTTSDPKLVVVHSAGATPIVPGDIIYY